MVTAVAAAAYLEAYVRNYRQEYDALIADPPEGGGYPRLSISSYLDARLLRCFVGVDGAVVLDDSRDPPNPNWAIAGGPALLVDTEPTRRPEWVDNALRERGLLGKPIGLYRIVGDVPDETWRGVLPPSTGEFGVVVDGTEISVATFDQSVAELVERLTFGAFGTILDPRLPGEEADFWKPHIVRNLGFATADRVHQRFASYMEILHHGVDPAWDLRSVATRVVADVRRDYAHAATAPLGGATFSMGARPGDTAAGEALSSLGVDSRAAVKRRSAILADAIQDFRELLDALPARPEEAFQEYLEEHPVLLDAYSDPVAHPRFAYPDDSRSAVGKSYVEPDFILVSPGPQYTLVEIERPTKAIGTASGRPSADVTQPAFQIAEWVDFIRHHPDVVEREFPGLPASYSTMIIISRRTAEASGGRDPVKYRTLVHTTYKVDQVFFFDDLIDRAEVLRSKLEALNQ